MAASWRYTPEKAITPPAPNRTPRIR